MEPMPGLPDFEASFAVFSAEGGLGAPNAPVACSKGLPEDFGVLAVPANPKAPDPRPNWLEALAVGDVTPVAGAGAALKGFERPWDEEGPALRLVREE